MSSPRYRKLFFTTSPSRQAGCFNYFNASPRFCCLKRVRILDVRELDNSTLRRTGGAYGSPSGRFTGIQYRRERGDKSHLPFREENGSNRKQLPHRLSYPVNRRSTGGARLSQRRKEERESVSMCVCVFERERELAGLLTVRSQVINLIAAALCERQFQARYGSAKESRGKDRRSLVVTSPIPTTYISSVASAHKTGFVLRSMDRIEES